MIPQYKTTDIPVLFQNWYFTFFPVRLPEDLEQQTVKFHRFVITSRQRHGYSLSRIFIFSVKTH